ncbi:MAG: threonine synthase [Gemmatimonadota bacterium]
MRLRSTRTPSDAGDDGDVSLGEGVRRGLADDGGLYLPVTWPRLAPPPARLPQTPGATAAWSAPRLLGSPRGDAVDEPDWASIATAALDFPVPWTPLGDDLRLLELFHGPTLSFKDVGARFLAHLLASEGGGARTILVATSGDTGGAVAHAIQGVPGLRAAILFPRGRVSEVQRRQFTTLGPDVLAIEVEGPFDRAQALVKAALGDPGAVSAYRLTSANSINPGRLLPQVFYYLHLARLQGWGREDPGTPGDVVVPSGNLGNVTAGVLAQRAGAPLGRLIAACNRNDALVRFQADGRTRALPVRPTRSSAMDVGTPSNLERLESLFRHDVGALASGLPAWSASPAETRDSMAWAWREHGVLIDPHTAVGVAVARREVSSGADAAPVTVLATAHPAKFPTAVREATGQTPEVPEALRRGGTRESVATLGGSLHDLLQLLREWGP